MAEGSTYDEVRHVIATDAGRGADAPPATPVPPIDHDHNYCASRAITLGLDWSAVAPAFIRYGEPVLNVAENLRRVGFSAAWVQELIQVGMGNGMLMAMMYQGRQK